MKCITMLLWYKMVQNKAHRKGFVIGVTELWVL